MTDHRRDPHRKRSRDIEEHCARGAISRTCYVLAFSVTNPGLPACYELPGLPFLCTKMDRRAVYVPVSSASDISRAERSDLSLGWSKRARNLADCGRHPVRRFTSVSLVLLNRYVSLRLTLLFRLFSSTPLPPVFRGRALRHAGCAGVAFRGLKRGKVSSHSEQANWKTEVLCI